MIYPGYFWCVFYITYPSLRWDTVKSKIFQLYVDHVLELPLNINKVTRPHGNLVVTKLTHELEYFYPTAVTDKTNGTSFKVFSVQFESGSMLLLWDGLSFFSRYIYLWITPTQFKVANPVRIRRQRPTSTLDEDVEEVVHLLTVRVGDLWPRRVQISFLPTRPGCHAPVPSKNLTQHLVLSSHSILLKMLRSPETLNHSCSVPDGTLTAFWEASHISF